jgi:glutamate racemase
MPAPPLGSTDGAGWTPGRQPVGVFDSGVGGISVLHEIRRLLPAADLVYVADSGHCPYGAKSEDEIRARSRAIVQFLLASHGAKAIVVACNTATAAAIEPLRQTFTSVPIVGMEPALKPAAAATRSGVVGVLATGATLGGERFAGLAARFSDGIELLTQACPGLVEQVERGDLDGPETRQLLREYVDPLLARGADTLVLGCTHYPFLRPVLRELVGTDVTILDTGAAVARQLARVTASDAVSASTYEQSPLEAGACRRGRTTFWSSDVSVAPVIARLWGAPAEVAPLPV